MRKGPWCQKLKLNPYDVACKRGEEIITYLGIAADEPKRFGDLSETTKSPLKELGWTEGDCRSWCERNGLLSPVYTEAERSGCWFCHNQGVGQLRLLRKNYPEYWSLMLKWDQDSPVTFHADGHTVHDFDRRFKLEELKIVPTDRRFRWAMCSQVNLFELMEADVVS